MPRLYPTLKDEILRALLIKHGVTDVGIAFGMLDFDNWIPYDRENKPLPAKQKLLAYQYDAFTHITQAMESTMWAK